VKRVSGKVLEQDTDIPLLGVSILVKGTINGTTSDFNGNYTIAGVDGSSGIGAYHGKTSFDIFSTIRA
jgi:hypothetical protein